MIGRTIGHYRILSELGRGGMGVVYEAQDTKLGRRVALKVLPPELAGEPERLARLRRESRAVASINHPNIVTIYSVDELDGHVFLSLEKVEGATLERHVPRGGLDLEEFFEVAVPLADAVSAAHEQGVIHRDLKPSNVMLTPQGRVKVLDFGLAKLRREERARDGTLLSTEPLTTGGRVGGTIPFMSPEHLRGEPVDHRSDVFSLGVILYFMATGKRPFRGGSSADVASSILRDEPSSVSELRAGLPNHLGRIIRHAMEKAPDRRFQSAKDLRNELEDLRRELFAGEGSTTALALPRARRRPRRRVAGAAAAAVVVLAAAAATLVWTRGERAGPPPARPGYLAVGSFRSFTGEEGPAHLRRGVAEMLRRRLAALRGAYVVRAGGDPEPDLLLEVDARRGGGALSVSYRLSDDARRVVTGDVLQGRPERLDELLDRIGEAAARALAEGLERPADYSPAAPRDLDPQALDLYFRGLHALYPEGSAADPEAALAALAGAAERAPDFAPAHAALGEARRRAHMDRPEAALLDAAREACDRALALDPGLAPARVCRGDLLRGLERPLEAVEEYLAAIAADPTEIDAYLGLEMANLALGLREPGERAWRRAIELAPDFWAGHFFLGAFFSDYGEYREALAHLERSRELAPRNATVETGLGGIFYFLGRYEEAIRALERSLEIRPDFPAYSNLGSVAFILRLFEDAVRAYERAVGFESADYRTWGNLARAYYWAPGRRGEARAAFERAVEMCEARLAAEPGDADAMILMAYDLAMLDEGERALAALEKALAMRPNEGHYFYLAALVHSRLGDREAALDWLERSVAGGYSTAEIRTSAELDELRTEPRFKALLNPQ